MLLLLYKFFTGDTLLRSLMTAVCKCQELSRHIREGHATQDTAALLFETKLTFSLFLQYCLQEDFGHPWVLYYPQNESHFPPQALHGKM